MSLILGEIAGNDSAETVPLTGFEAEYEAGSAEAYVGFAHAVSSAAVLVPLTAAFAAALLVFDC